jgi:L-alanine-DL-glutamate epimerase-like enolase superfamily enzyme
MKLREFVIREIAIPFRTNFKHALATRKKTSAVIFEIVGADGVRGYGEAAPRKYVTGESVPSTMGALERAAEKLSHLELNPAQDVSAKLTAWDAVSKADLHHAPSAQCAVELALLDLFGKLLEKPVIDLLGPQQTTRIFYSGVLSKGPPHEAPPILKGMQAIGLKQVKIKVGRDLKSDLERVKLSQSILGEDIELRIDANGAWSVKEAVEKIKRFGDCGIRIVEQPLPADHREDYPLLKKKIDPGIDIILDEGICTLEDARWFVQNQGASGFSLKVSKHGGLRNTLAIYQLASANGFVCQLGCHVGETSILTAAGRIFAGLAQRLTAYEGAYGHLLLTRDIVENPLQFGPCGEYDLGDLTTSPGLGIQIDPFLLDKASISELRRWCNC